MIRLFLRVLRSRAAAIFAASILLASGAVRAEMISFNFLSGSTSASGVSSLSFTGTPSVPPLGLNVSATAGGNVTQSTTAGLGVSGGRNGDAFFLNHNETLLFDFSDTITLNSISFRMVEPGNQPQANNGDNAVVLNVSNSSTTLFNQSITTTGSGTIQGFSLDLSGFGSASTRRGLQFSISGVDGNDDFGIGALTVDYTVIAPPGNPQNDPPNQQPPHQDPPDVSVAPLPPAAMAGFGLIGCVAVRRHLRRRYRRAMAIE